GDATAAQCAPPSLVVIMVPLRPTAAHCAALAQLMPHKLAAVPVVVGYHRPPPFVVASTVPASPAAKQTCSLGQLTAWSGVEIPELGLNHVVPPFEVAAIQPWFPTATHVIALAQAIRLSQPAIRGSYDVCQVEPPSLVATAIMSAVVWLSIPTAMQAETVGHAIPVSAPDSVATVACATQVAPPSDVVITWFPGPATAQKVRPWQLTWPRSSLTGVCCDDHVLPSLVAISSPNEPDA